jgi:hypothetical protein
MDSRSVETVFKALLTLELYHPTAARRVRRNIKIIIVRREGRSGYLAAPRISVVNIDAIPVSCAVARHPLVIAGLLTRHATLGALFRRKILCFGKGRGRIDKLCLREQERVVTDGITS